MPELKVTWDKAKLEALAAVGGHLGRALATGTRRILVNAADRIVLEIRSGRSLHQRSGSLAKSWQVGEAELTVRERGAAVEGTLGSSHPASRIQQTGGDVTPKRARYLAVPLAPAKTAAGVSRFPSPRDVPGLFFVQSRAGNKLLARARGKGIEPWYVLLKRTRIPPSEYLTNALDKVRADDIMTAAIDEEIGRALRGGGAA